MTIQTYLDSRMAKVGSELADVERDLAGCIQQTEWTEFSNRASKSMDKAYASFCSSIYWGIVRGASARSGWRPPRKATSDSTEA